MLALCMPMLLLLSLGLCLLNQFIMWACSTANARLISLLHHTCGSLCSHMFDGIQLLIKSLLSSVPAQPACSGGRSLAKFVIAAVQLL